MSCVLAVTCGIGHRHGLDPVLLWLWLWPAAVAPIGPLVWDPPYVLGVALKSKSKTKQNKTNIYVCVCVCVCVVA